jgi:hypothetical protein
MQPRVVPDVFHMSVWPFHDVEHIGSNPNERRLRPHICRPSAPNTEEDAVSKIPPAAWEDPEAFEPDEVREVMVEPDPEDERPPRRPVEDDEDLED